MVKKGTYPTAPEYPRQNREGLTWVEWYRAACVAMGRGMGPADFRPMRQAWLAGVDPTDWGQS